MNNVIVSFPNGDFTTKEYLDKTSSIDLQIKSISDVIVHNFSMGDVEDPDIYAAEPLYKWQNSEEGKWIMEHAIEEPVWHKMADPITMGWRYTITAKLTDKDYTFWILKWGELIHDR